MKLLKKSVLAFQEGNADKVYDVDRCELASRKDERYLVNFWYGRKGNKAISVIPKLPHHGHLNLSRK